MLAAKAQLRALMTDRLAAMSPAERAAKSAEVVRRLLLCDQYRAARRVSVYLSMPEEVGTDAIVADLLDSPGGRKLFVPRYSRSGGMDMLSVADRADLLSLPVTRWGIRQPALGDADGRKDGLSDGGLDLILVPGLAFTRTGCRLGRGMGYYDRYLGLARRANPQCRAIALAFREQLVDELPTSKTDQLVDLVISD